MTLVPVDISGIVAGQTLIWNGTQFVKGSRTAGSAPRTSSSVNGLGAGAFDGEQAIIRVGTYPNIHEEPLSWSAAQARWLGEEHVLVTQGDTWAMDLGNRSGAQMLDWSVVDNPVPFGKSFALLSGSHNLSASNFNVGTGTGVITVDDTTSPHSFPFQATGTSGAYLRCRDNYITYTGKTSTTFTGCTVVQGSRGTIPDTEFVSQGYPGGWGFSIVSLAFAKQLADAGLRPQERLMSMMNSAPGEKKLSVAPYWFEYDAGDGTAAATVPPSGGLGASATLLSLALTGGTQANGERTFYLTANDWSDWPLTAPTKHFLVPRIIAKMESGATLGGSLLDTRLGIRWAS